MLRLGVRIGYTLITWSNPVRPGDQIEAINRNQPVGPVAPTIPFRRDLFWVQGLNLGMDWKWYMSGLSKSESSEPEASATIRLRSSLTLPARKNMGHRR